MEGLIAILLPIFKSQPVMAGLSYLLTAGSKALWEKYQGQIPNQLVPIISILIGSILGTATTGDPVSGIVTGSVAGGAAVGIHNILKPKEDKSTEEGGKE